MQNIFKNKRVLITGAAGTIGKELIKQLIESGVSEIKAIDNNESALFYLNEEHRHTESYSGYYCDIRDVDHLRYLVKNVDIILHTAALKHVSISEISPFDAVKTNAEGTLNVVSAALESEKVSRVIYTSSDKAVNSTNVMGTTKLLGERIMTSASNFHHGKDIIFSSTRFGNVIGSNGSVVPLFHQQIREGNTVTITHKDMTRFFMTTPQAVSLVMEAASIAKGGEVFVTKMPVIKIVELAEAMIQVLAPYYNKQAKDISLQFIGSKPGEKLYEELMTEEEINRAYELKNMFVIKPAIPTKYREINYLDYDGFVKDSISKPYHSANEPALSMDQIKSFLINNRVIDLPFNAYSSLSEIFAKHSNSTTSTEAVAI